MDFTREPIIETIITPKDGCKLAIRSSKGAGQEEYFVDAVEVVSFGHALFFRSQERPKAFLVPIADYEVVEVREARMVLKSVGTERSIKIGGGREAGKAHKEAEKAETVISSEEEILPAATEATEQTGETRQEVRLDKKRDRRRNYRKRRNGKEEGVKEEGASEAIPVSVPPLEEGGIVNIEAPQEGAEKAAENTPLSPNILSSLLQPPPTLISETINRYRENALFKNAFFLTEEDQYKPHAKADELLSEDEELIQQEVPTVDVQLPLFEEASDQNPENGSETVAEPVVNNKKERNSRKKAETEQKEEGATMIQMPLYADEGFNGIKEQEPVYSEPSENVTPQEHKPEENHKVEESQNT